MIPDWQNTSLVMSRREKDLAFLMMQLATEEDKLDYLLTVIEFGNVELMKTAVLKCNKLIDERHISAAIKTGSVWCIQSLIWGFPAFSFDKITSTHVKEAEEVNEEVANLIYGYHRTPSYNQINDTARLFVSVYGTDKVFFSPLKNVPSEVLAIIAAETRDPSVHTSEEALAIAQRQFK